ncbi:MAG: YIP1 family protein [Gemmatimonadales bacterium]
MNNTASTDSQSAGALWLALRVLDEPAKVFQSLASKPRALIPIVLLVLASVVVAFATPERVLKNQVREQLEAFRGGGGLTDEQFQERLDAAASPGSRVSILGFGSVGGVVGLVIVAAVLMLIFGATSGSPVRFKDEFAIVAHANVASIAGAVLVVALTVFAGFDQLQLSVGFLFDQETQPFLYRFANQITVFGAWNVFLIALGNKIKTEAQGLGTPLAIVGGLWIVTKLLFAALGGLAAGLAG